MEPNHSTAETKEKQRRKPKCLNRVCRTRNDLVDAIRIVCSYYDANYKPAKEVCTACLKKCLRHYKRLGMKLKKGKCIMESTFPCNNEFIVNDDSSSEEEEEEEKDQKPSTSELGLPQDPEVKKAVEDAVQHFFDKNKQLIQHQFKLCNEYLDKQIQECKTGADDLDKLASDLEGEMESLRNEIYALYPPI